MRDLLLGMTVWIGLSAVACGTDPHAGSLQGRASASVLFASPGRVEGSSDVIEIGTAMDGVLRKVHVRAGDVVEAGAVLAELACDARLAAFAARRAELDSAVQIERRILRGARDEERSVAHATTAAALAQWTYARMRFARLERLGHDESSISENDLEEARQELDVAEARHFAAAETERLVEAGPLPEERARAKADVDGAAERARQAATAVEECKLKAPIGGTVLRVHIAAGEQVSLALPRPVISLADSTRLRVRAEVDERDVGRVRMGQTARIQAEALAGDELQGRIVQIEPLMGRKRTRTGDPAEKSDRDVLEVLLDLERTDERLVIGLRVTVLFGV